MSAVYAKYVSTPIHSVEFPQKNQFPNKPGFPLSALIILVWYPYVSLFPDLLCNIGLSVSGLRKIRFNAYTPRRISTKNQFPNKPVFPLPKLIILVWYPYVSLFPDLLCYRFECQRFTQNTFQRLYTPSNFHKKISFQTNQDSRCRR